MRTVHCHLSGRELDKLLDRPYREPEPEYVPAFLDDISEIEAELDEVPKDYPEEPEIIDFPIYSELKEAA
jgi:hypothetical protein